MDVDLARDIARTRHVGQTDLSGRDYAIGHLAPIAEAASVFGPDAAAAGWLHDVIEDTDTSAEELIALGVAPDVVRAVESVSRRADETYAELIARAAADGLGRYVKLADNGWNIACNPGLAEIDPVKAAELISVKYLPARERLLAACGLDLESAEVVEMQRVFARHLDALG